MFREIYMYVLGALIVIGFFVILTYLVFHGKYESTINLLIGTLIGSFTTVVGYFFGSSMGSANKDKLLHDKNNT